MSFWKWSRTAANNATADGSIDWAEGACASTVTDCARELRRRHSCCPA
jgi:chloramphenicol 3-O-phosphotransferase